MVKQNQFDSIVIGAGMSGGWAVKEFCEQGFKTLLIERGRNVVHLKDYPTTNMLPWEFKHRGNVPAKIREENPIAHSCYAFREDAIHFFTKDAEHPYIQTKPFQWIRGYQVGGKSIMWARQVQRWSNLDFEGPARDGFAVDWPIRYIDLAPWYTYVEKFAGISGEALGLPQLPDSHFLPPMELNCVEKHVKSRIEKEFPGRHMIVGRVAHLTQPLNGRGQCQYRNRCSRGCPYGAYFSSNSVTLPAANATGNLTIRPYSIVESIIYDEKKEKAVGVRIVDAETNQSYSFYSKIIFSNASTLSTTQILLNSTSSRFENGFGNDSGELGHNLMDHTYRVGAMGNVDGFENEYYKGRRPNGIYIPRYVNLQGQKQSKDFLRGFGFQGGGGRSDLKAAANLPSFGADFKRALMQPEPWEFFITGFAECLPYHENKVSLNKDVLDKWGNPTLTIDSEFKENEKMANRQIQKDAVEMLEKAGLSNIVGFDNEHEQGNGIHEMGTARMGHDPKTSVLNKFNQVHAAKNVFVSDGACMTSSSCVNPSLTYMAITARAANHAVSELNKQNI